MTDKKVLAIQPAGSSGFGADVRQVIPAAIRNVDPFVFLDHYGPFDKQPGWEGVPFHPHAGIATITYVIAGTNRHLDTYGHDAFMSEGDLAWMVAGKGIEHAEGRHAKEMAPEVSHGIQFWISLPAKDKFVEPDFFHYPSEILPKLGWDGAEVKVLCGTFQGHTSPTVSLSPAYMFELRLSAGRSTELPIQAANTCALYVIEGAVTSDRKQVGEYSIANFEAEGETLVVTANADTHFVVFGGIPLNEPIVSRGSFVMNSEAQIAQVVTSYRRGEMRLADRSDT